jgi:hypothetical protein
MTLLVYEFFITFKREVRYVWAAEWSFVKGIFLVQRYITFVDGATRLAACESLYLS